MRSTADLSPNEQYLGSVIRFLVVTVGLHLSRTVADLPCLQAWVVSLDLHHKQSWVSNYIYIFLYFLINTFSIKYLPWHLWTWKHHKVWLEQHKQEIVIIFTWNRIWHLAGWTKRETANLEKRCHSGACQWSHLQNKKTWDVTQLQYLIDDTHTKETRNSNQLAIKCCRLKKIISSHEAISICSI